MQQVIHKRTNRRLLYISFLQVVGPIFVILGHSMNGMPYHWLLSPLFKDYIYIFHMPLFFFISGYMFSYKGLLNNKRYLSFIKGKFKRLLIPYIVYNSLFIIPKYFASSFIVDEVVFSTDYIMQHLITPRMAVWGHLWFLFALFEVFLIAAPLFSYIVNKNNKLLNFIITCGLIYLYFNPAETYVLALSDLSRDILLFWLGILIGKYPYESIKSTIDNKKISITLIVTTLVLSILSFMIKESEVLNLSVCVSVILTLFILPIYFKINSNLIENLSKLSFGIYIMHWPVMILIRIILYQILQLNSLLVVLLMNLGGFFIPITILKLLKQSKIVNRYRWTYYLFGI